MGTYCARRLLLIVPVLLGILVLTSVMIHLTPGDPIDSLAGDFASDADKQELREKLGLDQPLPLQIYHYARNAIKLDLGQSIVSGKAVTSLIKERIFATIELAFYSILLALLIAIPIGIFSAVRRNTVWDWGSMTLAVLGVAIPNFWLGPMLILLFSIHWDLLPVSERMGWESYILPCFTLGTSLAAVLTRMTRASVLEMLNEDFVRTARSKGLSERSILYKHVLRNSATPVLTIVGLQFGVLLTGSIITEQIFDWPGLGSLIINAIHQRDYPVVQGCVLFFSSIYVFVNLFTDLGYAWLDPRVQLEK